MVKTIVVEGAETPMVALVFLGDDTLNEIKASKHPLVKSPLRFIEEAEAKKALGVSFGSLGPINLSIPVIVDHYALALPEFVCGANEEGKHYTHAHWQRDVKSYQAFDLRNVKVGDKSPDGNGHLQACKGIEVGHVFQLGNKYAEAMKAEVLNEKGRLETMLMGCYGIGVTRLVAAAIEQHHDAKGIIWPKALAPFQLVIVPLNGHRNGAVLKKAESIYQSCLDLGIDVLLEDREERAGVLFADADLVGIPHRLVVSERNLDAGRVEYKARNKEDSELWDFDEVEVRLREFLV